MVSPDPRVFDARELLTIDRVYEAAWAELEARDPLRDKFKDDERRAALKARVLNLARSRKVEFGTLYQMVLTTIPQNWTTTDGGSSSDVGQQSDAARNTNKLQPRETLTSFISERSPASLRRPPSPASLTAACSKSNRYSGFGSHHSPRGIARDNFPPDAETV